MIVQFSGEITGNLLTERGESICDANESKKFGGEEDRVWGTNTTSY